MTSISIVQKWKVSEIWIMLPTKIILEAKKLTPTWLEHAAFWSGVRRATIAPRSLHSNTDIMEALYHSVIVLSATTWNVNQRASVGGIVVSIAAFQAVDPGSIPGQRILFHLIACMQ